MPPAQSFARHDVIEAAIRVVERQGPAALKARAVAEALGASVAPVYKQFASMEELSQAVVNEALLRLVAHARRPWTEGRFLNMGAGLVFFAREHANLYRLIFLDSDRYLPQLRELMATLEADLADDPQFVALSDAQRRQMLDTMWTVTHGLAARVVAGLAPDTSDEALVGFLAQVGGAVIARTWLDAGVPVEEVLARLANNGPAISDGAPAAGAKEEL